VTTAVSSPLSSHLFGGVSFAFSTSAAHPLSPHAIINPATALHLNFHTGKESTSTKIAFIRRLLRGESDEVNEITEAMKKVAKGELRLVIDVTKADIMGALVRLKREVAPKVQMTFVGAHESWMVSFCTFKKTRSEERKSRVADSGRSPTSSPMRKSES
jgi:hypothetical protein